MENVLRIHVLSPSVLGYQAQMRTKIVFIIEHYDAFLSALKFTLMFPFFMYEKKINHSKQFWKFNYKIVVKNIVYGKNLI